MRPSGKLYGGSENVNVDVFTVAESIGATLIEEYHFVLGNLQHSGELESKTADEKPEEEY